MPTIDIHKLRAGDHGAFESVVHSYYAYVYRLSLRMLGNAGDAEDAAQEAFLRIHRSVSRFKGEASLSTWIYRIAYNTCLDELRRQKRRPITPLDEVAHGTLHLTDGRRGPEDTVVATEESQTVRDGLAELPVEYRIVLVLREVEDLSYDEIASVLKCPVGTVRSRLARGRRMLADKLKGRVQNEVSNDIREASSS